MLQLAGRLTLRAAWMMPEAYTFVHFNDIAAIESIAYLIKYDSIHGIWPPMVKVDGSHIVITEGDRIVRVVYSQESNPSEVCADKCQYRHVQGQSL